MREASTIFEQAQDRTSDARKEVSTWQNGTKPTSTVRDIGSSSSSSSLGAICSDGEQTRLTTLDCLDNMESVGDAVLESLRLDSS